MSKWWYKKRGELSRGHGQRASGNKGREVKSKSSSTVGEMIFLNSFLVSENRFLEKKKSRNVSFHYRPLTLVVEPCSQHLDCRVHLRMVQPAWDSMNSWTETSSADGFHSGAKLLWSHSLTWCNCREGWVGKEGNSIHKCSSYRCLGIRGRKWVLSSRQTYSLTGLQQ